MWQVKLSVVCLYEPAAAGNVIDLLHDAVDRGFGTQVRAVKVNAQHAAERCERFEFAVA